MGLNRAARRANAKQNKVPMNNVATLNIRKTDLGKMKKDACKDAINIAFGLLLGLPLIVLKDKYGFGRKRLGDFLEEIVNQYQCYEEGHVDIEDIIKRIEHETDLEIRNDKWREIKLQKTNNCGRRDMLLQI